MSNFNFEGHSDDNDDRGDLSWEEYDWQQYLARHEQEVERFIDTYNKLKDQPDHIDEVARQMGWEAEDWSVGEEDGESSSFDTSAREEEEVEAEGESFDPYTILRHPVYVVVRGLYRHMRRQWAQFQMRHDREMSPTLSWALAQGFSEGETHATLALQSLDMGDYALAVCQLKLSLESINKTFAILPAVLPNRTQGEQRMEEELRVRLFDLREVLLRVMNDCREEIRRRR
jgi:hypothetical protein